jgi:hypothetical protein
MPPDYDFPTTQTDVWAPDRLNPASENFGGHHLNGIARLAPGATLESAEQDAESLIARFDEIGYGPGVVRGHLQRGGGRAHAEGGDHRRLPAAAPHPARHGRVRAPHRVQQRGEPAPRARRVAHARARRAHRARLGPRPPHAVRPDGEHAPLARRRRGGDRCSPGSARGRWCPPGPRASRGSTRSALNSNVLLFTTAVSVVAGLLFGLLPALRAGSKRTLAALRDGGRGSTIGRDPHRARSVLVVGQVALALMLLVGSGSWCAASSSSAPSTRASAPRA